MRAAPEGQVTTVLRWPWKRAAEAEEVPDLYDAATIVMKQRLEQVSADMEAMADELSMKSEELRELAMKVGP